MKRLIPIFFIPAAVLLLALPVFAQELPDSVFDKPSQAFGNSVQDVPPDILAVEVTPDQPAAGQQIHVSAHIWVDPEISKFKVKEAYVYYRDISDKTGMKRVSMLKAAERIDWWEATLPGFEKGAEIEISVRAVDEIGNEVIQLPRIPDVGPDHMIEMLMDGADQDIPSSMDVISVKLGYDGANLVACSLLGGPFQTYSSLGADVLVLGFIEDDVRVNPTRSITENTAGFAGYFPAMNLTGIYNIQELAGSARETRGDAAVKIAGRNICLTARVNQLTATPRRGLKVFSATAGVDLVNELLNLGDSTPYAILYFGGRRLSIGAGIP